MKLITHLCIMIPTSTFEFQHPSFFGWVEKGHYEEWETPFSIPPGYVEIARFEAEAPIDWPAITAQAIQRLEDRKRKVRGEAEATVTELEGTIQSFLALGAPE